MDEGEPIAYALVEKGIPVLSRDGDEVGTVDHIVAAPEQDIFHGVVIKSARLGKRFVPAEDIAALHEGGVDLRIDSGEISELPLPHGRAPEFSDDPAETKWGHWSRRLRLKGDWRPRA